MEKRAREGTPKINLALSLKYLLHDYALVRNRMDAAVERLDVLERELQQIIKYIDDHLHELAQSSAPGLRAGWEIDTAPVAFNVTAQPGHDDSLAVAIDGGETFILPQRLAQVFAFIASADKDRSHRDALVGWRSRIEISAYLEKQTGKRFTQKYINQMVYRLKNALHSAGYNPRLIQSSRAKGVRLAYKHGAQGGPYPWTTALSSPPLVPNLSTKSPLPQDGDSPL